MWSQQCLQIRKTANNVWRGKDLEEYDLHINLIPGLCLQDPYQINATGRVGRLADYHSLLPIWSMNLISPPFP